MTTPSTAPVPSNLPQDLLYNAEQIDRAVSSGERTYRDRRGVDRMTLTGAVETIKAVNVRGAWTPSTSYDLKDVVTVVGGGVTISYICISAHTSSATIDSDLEARWRVFQGVLVSDLADFSDVLKGDDLLAVKRTAPGAVATTQHDWNERQQLDTWADFDLAPDSVTDHSGPIATILAGLGGVGFRGQLRIPSGTKFNPVTVFAAVPTGVGLDITDTVNWGQPPSYKNKFKILFYGDTVSDDSQQVLASGHHPAMMLLNMGTAGSAAAAARFGSILHGVGMDADKDPMLGWLYQFAKSPTANKWRTSWRLQTPYLVAIGNPSAWTTAQVVASGAYRTSDGGKVYKTTLGGTCGPTAPTGTGTAIYDGGVLWDYVQAAINIDSTRMDLDEDGNVGFYGPMTVRATLTGGAQTAYFEVNSSTGDVTLRDELRSTDLWRSSTTNGVRSGRIQSYNRVNSTVSITGAFQIVTGLHFLTASGGPWDITDLTLPTGQTSGEVRLWFSGTGINLKNNANIVTRTGADIASAANLMVTLYKDTSVSGSWIVMNKN